MYTTVKYYLFTTYAQLVNNTSQMCLISIAFYVK